MNKSIKTIGIYVIGLICIIALLFGTNVLKHEEFKPYTTITVNNEVEIKSQLLVYLDSVGDFNNEKCKEAVSFLNRSKDDISPEAFNELKALVCDSIALFAESYIDDILSRDKLEYSPLSRCDANALQILIKEGWSNKTIEDCYEIVQLVKKIVNLHGWDLYNVNTDTHTLEFNDKSFKYTVNVRKKKININGEIIKKNIKQMMEAIKNDSYFKRIEQYSCVQKKLNVDNVYNNIIEKIKHDEDIQD